MEEDNQGQQEKTETKLEAKPEAKSKLIPTLIIGLVIVVVVVGYFAFGRGGYQAPAPATTEVGKQAPDTREEVPAEEAEVREITVEGDQYSFSPSSITVRSGERVKLTFNNVGSLPHNLTVEGLGIATRTIGAGQSDSIEFTVEEGGTYATFCSVGNHRAQGMEGKLVIE